MRGLRHFMGGILLGLTLTGLVEGGAASAKEALLTGDSVSRFLASFEEMRDIAIAEGLKTGADSEAARNPLGAVLRAIKSTKLKSEAEKIAAAHGFADLKDWAGTGGSIAEAYVFITSGPSRGVARETLQKNKEGAIKQLEKLGLLSENSKKKLRENLDGLEDRLAREPPPENVAIVKRMKAEIDAAVQFGPK